MPSSITLTVSHLPTSTSFFLSALQPLEYAYRGRNHNTIGFGSTTNPSAPADFWITQEIPGIPAGAAHVAFQAPSKTAVQHFFTAALKAGGKFHGEPAVRDNSGYYSAAVIDFDGNSIEAVFRPDASDDKENDVQSAVSSKAISKVTPDAKSQVSSAPPSEIKSSISRSAPPTEALTPVRMASGEIIENIVTEARSAADVARTLVQSVSGSSASQARPSGNGESNAILGTLLGVAAGAALHYAFTHDKASNSRPRTIARSITEPMITSHHQPYGQLEAPQYIALKDNDYVSTIRPARSTASSRHTTTGGQVVYSTGFGNGSIAPSTVSKANQTTNGPRMIEAPPSSFKPPTPSRLSRSSSHHTKPPSTTPSPASRPSITRQASERSSPNPPTTTTTTRHHVVRTTSESQIQRTSTCTPPSAAAISRTSRPARLSEANLAHVTSAPPAVSAQSVPPSVVSLSLHSKNREPEGYPIDPDGRGKSKAGSKAGSRSASRVKHSSSSSKVAAGIGSGTGTGTGRMGVEVRPEDSISQISSLRSASTVRPSRKG